MHNQLLKVKITIITLCLMVGSFGFIGKVKAAAAPLIFVKKLIYNTNSISPNNVNASDQATVAASTDVVQVIIGVTNTSDTDTTVTINDYYSDGVSGFSDVVCGSGAGECGWYSNQDGSGGRQKIVNESDGHNGTLSTSISVPKSNTARYLRYRLKNPVLPTYTSRLDVYPVKVSTSSMPLSIADASYVIFLPNGATATTSSYIKPVDNAGNKIFDMGISFPGASATASGSPQVKSSSTFVYVPYNDTTGSSSAKYCDSIPLTNNRGGTCMFSATARVKVDTGGGNMVEAGASTAYVMALPTVSVVGSIFSGTNSDVSQVILPGQHVVSNTLKGSTASDTVQYNISGNSTSGWQNAQIYNNVYLNANIARLRDNANVIIDSNNYSSFNNSSFTIDHSGSNFYLRVTGGSSKRVLDLSDPTLTNNNSNPVKASHPSSNPPVLRVKGNLYIVRDNGGNDPNTLINVAGGTILADGDIYIENVNIESASAEEKVSLPLGIMAPNGNIKWEMNGTSAHGYGGLKDDNETSTLNSVAFFAKNTFSAATSNNKYSLILKGSIVADQVSLSDVKQPQEVGGLAVQIIYDAKLSSSPPAGFSVFANSPIQQEGGQK